MLGLVIAGNIAMVFVFWELVGICSYFLIGFYIERKSDCADQRTTQLTYECRKLYGGRDI